MKKHFMAFNISIVLLYANIAISQNFPCGTDEMHQQLFQDFPQYNPGIIRANERLQKDTKNFIENGSQKSEALYVIPVVFHVIHNYGVENISDAQIHDALRQVNIQFRKNNADTSEIHPNFKSIAADIEVEFRLAQLDPDGNCTSGITRTVSPLTTPGNHDVKSLIHWPQEKYLNIYICKGADGLAGHALLPSAADTIPQWDGIVMQHSYVGTIGTSDYFRRTVLSHEIGHFLNLQHIWGGNNVPNYYYLPVAQSSNCDFDDDVLDTPNTIGWQSCNINGTTCGDLDNVQNYMDYAYCGRMFTEGQKARMHACLNSSVANRNNLWQESNLIATGTDNLTYYLCDAKFHSDKRIACVNEPIVFSDISYHGIETRNWEFEGGTDLTSSDSVVTVTYANPGKYNVQLKVVRGAEEKMILLEDYIEILPDTGGPPHTFETFENELHVTQIPSTYPSIWKVTDAAGFNSNKSFFINNFESELNYLNEFIFTPINLDGLTEAVISFDVAYAQINSSSNDKLQVFVSTDCGETWIVRRTFLGSTSLKSVNSFYETSFIPANESEWKNEIVTVNNSSLTDNLMVRFSFTNNGGNNIFIDNIQVAHPQELSIPKNEILKISAHPNPASSTLTINSDGSIIEKITLVNIEGKVVLSSLNIQAESYDLNLEAVSAGAYILHVQTKDGNYQCKQLIKD